jgi:hypothetical protein
MVNASGGKATGLIGAAAGRRAALSELRRVTLAQSVQSDEGMLPAGSTGTIVHVWQDGEYYEVEFTAPFQAIATVMADDIVA